MCESAYSADDALDKFQKISHEIVIVDYMISGFDGIELLKKIKEINSDTIVIMITGNGNSQIAERANEFSPPQADGVSFFLQNKVICVLGF